MFVLNTINDNNTLNKIAIYENRDQANRHACELRAQGYDTYIYDTPQVKKYRLITALMLMPKTYATCEHFGKAYEYDNLEWAKNQAEILNSVYGTRIRIIER